RAPAEAGTLCSARTPSLVTPDGARLTGDLTNRVSVGGVWPLAVVACRGRRRNKIDAETGRGEPVPPPVGRVEEGLALRDGRIALAEGPPGDIPALDHQVGLHPEKFRLPQHNIRDLARFE